MRVVDGNQAYSGQRPALSKGEIVLISLGVGCCLLGLWTNEVVQFYLSSFNWADVLPPRVRMALWLVNLTLLAWGGLTIIFRKRPSMVNLNLALISLVVVTPLTAELFIRSAIGLHVEFFRNPQLYAGWLDEDDHWKLRYSWGLTEVLHNENESFIPDPQLGWVPKKSRENPLGVVASRPYQPDFSAKTVLFYGNSYVHGMSPTPIEQRVPQQLDRLLPDYTVYNYGVVGYGTDQILLRFQQTYPEFGQPFVIIGIYTLDIDRSILQIQEAPKPYFEVVNQQLILKGVPVPPDTEVWLEQHPVSIRSYFLAFLRRQYRIAEGAFDPVEAPYKRAEKQRLNTAIIEAMSYEAEVKNLPLLFVLFYPDWQLQNQGWREVFLKEVLADLKQPYIDTKTLFLQQEGPVSRFYDPWHGHLNVLGSGVVAEAIAAYVEEQGEK